MKNTSLQLAPFSFAAFLGFLAIGIPLPVLPVFTHDALGFGPIIVGLVISSQSLATLLTRQFAGRACDERGPKRAALIGLLCASSTGICYLIANAITGFPLLSLAVVIFARLLLGLAESFFITSLAVWSIGRVGHANAGRAMVWSGLAMYAAIAVGAPLGSAIENAYGFNIVFASTFGLPLIAAIMISPWKDAIIEPGLRTSFFSILLKIWLPGLGMALASSGVGTISAFLALRYRELGLESAGMAFAGFGGSYILVRLFLGGLPDRIGGLLTAMVSLSIETIGLLLVWKAGSAPAMLLGASITGLGYSLVFPSLGVEAIRRATGENRGVVLGAYMACFDLGIALAGPVAGLVVSRSGLSSAFLAAASASFIALALLGSARLRMPASRA